MQIQRITLRMMSKNPLLRPKAIDMNKEQEKMGVKDML